MIDKCKESAKERYKRYEKAKTDFYFVRDRLEDCYRYFAPRRTSFLKSDAEKAPNRGSSLTNHLYDSTPVQLLNDYANNIQSALLPPYKKNYRLEPSAMVVNRYKENSSVLETYQRSLDRKSERLFEVVSESNLSLAINESYHDMGVSTGVNFINERTLSSGSISYSAVDPASVYFSEDLYNNKIENFWQDRVLKLRDIKQLWPDAQLTDSMKERLARSPNETVDVIEGCVYYPEEKGPNKYFYYVQDKAHSKDIVGRWLPYSPYTGFRAYKRSGETWGRGIADRMLPFARLLNIMAEYSIRAVKFHAFPPVGVVNGTPGFNPENIKIMPGSVIVMPMPNALQKLDFSGNPQPLYLERSYIVEQMQKAFFSDPLGDIGDVKGRSATEMHLRQQNWLRNNAVSVGRITQEAIIPILHKTLIAMKRKGIIDDPILDGEPVKIEHSSDFYKFSLQSPLIGIQDEEDMQQLDAFISRMQQLYGPNYVAILNNPKVIENYANKSHINLELIKSQDQLSDVLQSVSDTLEKNKDMLAKEKLEEAASSSMPPEDPNQILENLKGQM